MALNVQELFETKNPVSVTETKKKKFFLRKKSSSKNMESKKTDFLYQLIWITPALVFLVVFSYYSIFIVFRNGFNGARRPLLDFQGTVANFDNIFKDPNFIISLRNSLLYSVVVIPTTLLITLTTAKVLSNVLNKRMFSFLQSLFFLPYVTSAMAISMSFAYIFLPEKYGLANTILNSLGLGTVDWTSKKNGIFLVMIFGIWRTMPFQIIMFTATFLRIDPRYYQAASVDGMPKWKQFWKVSIPRAVPMIVYMITTGIIGSFKVFPLGLFGSYEASVAANAQTVVFYIFSKVNPSSAQQSYGKGGAASIVLMAIILVITIINRQISKVLTKKYK
ncbi:sugar ABC transporter permease [Spiroplasma helicoides]|uniref:Sugar ABC transporter permease n=1 Tax=Spiroplasma helicoides TaxID=216938 RepID=A0A1B3SLP6_9MOLU|nr:sugar ABC transporter permease [Spiroplasma helicoides]AOG60859.1 sugar ABC transporter permease [Spiroplasma helicoides]